MSKHDQDDGELQAYLRGDSALSKAYRALTREEPSTRLDRVILAKARRASPRPGAHHPFASHWMVPVSLAAVLLIGIGLVSLIPYESDVFAPKGLSPESDTAPPEGGVGRSADEVKSNAEAEVGSEGRLDVLREEAGAGGQAPARRAAPAKGNVETRQRPPVEDETAQKRRGIKTGIMEEPAPAAMDEAIGNEAYNARSLGDQIKLVRIGMSQAEVRQLLGEPVKQEKMTWIYREESVEDADAPVTLYRIYFEHSKVYRVEGMPAPDRADPKP